MNQSNDNNKHDKTPKTPQTPQATPNAKPAHDGDKAYQASQATPPRNGATEPSVTPQPASPAKPQADGAIPMSNQQQQSMPTVDAVKGKWKQQVGSAKIIWGKLTDDELLRSEGHEEKLTGLVEERYAITRAEAKKQVNGFLDKMKV